MQIEIDLKYVEGRRILNYNVMMRSVMVKMILTLNRIRKWLHK